MDNMHTRRQVPVTHTKQWISGTPHLLIYTPAATRRQLEIIGWLRTDFPRNHEEQGGWLIGHYLRDAAGHPIQAEVTHVLEAKTKCRYPGYIEWSALEEIRLQQEFFDMKEELASTDSKAAEDLCVIGWWHTHPNDLPVFMSGTDMETQRLKYFKPEKYAVVLNPHKGIWRAFAGVDAREVAAVMLVNEESTEPNNITKTDSSAKKQMDRYCRKQNRYQKGAKANGRNPKRESDHNAAARQN